MKLLLDEEVLVRLLEIGLAIDAGVRRERETRPHQLNEVNNCAALDLFIDAVEAQFHHEEFTFTEMMFEYIEHARLPKA